MTRSLFPMRLAIYLTINKPQGQSFYKVDIFVMCKETIITYEQLHFHYVKIEQESGNQIRKEVNRKYCT